MKTPTPALPAMPASHGEQALQILAELVSMIQAHGEITLHNKTEWMDTALKLILDEQDAAILADRNTRAVPVQGEAETCRTGG